MVECNKGSVFTIALFGFIFFTLILYYNSLPNDINGEILDFSVDYTNHSNKIFDLYLKYEINSNQCAENNSLAVIIVTSYFGNVETRSAMRRAYSSEMLRKYNISRVFLLAKSNEDKYVKQSAIQDEAEKFQDIVQGNFHEAYKNLTYKHIMGLKWASDNCKTAKYIVKMDDDIVVNMKTFISYLQTAKMPEKLLAGYILQGMKPIRLEANKWYVTKQEYSESTYPTFLSGWFYITNPATSSRLVTLTIYKPYFWIDDTYVTGILAQLLRIRHFNIGKYFTVHPEFLECCIRDAKKGLNCDLMVGPNGGDNNLFFDFNEALKDCPENCVDRILTLNQTCVAERKFNLGKGTSVIRNYNLV